MADSAAAPELIGLQLEAASLPLAAGALERLESLAAALQGQGNPRGYLPGYVVDHDDEILESLAGDFRTVADMLEGIRQYTRTGAIRAARLERESARELERLRALLAGDPWRATNDAIAEGIGGPWQ